MSWRQRISEAVKAGPLGLIRSYSRRVTHSVLPHGRADGSMRLPYLVHFFSAGQPVRVRATASPLSRRGRRFRRRR